MDEREVYNPWTIVRVVFDHLAQNGLHPTLGEGGNPGEAAADLLRTMGLESAPEGDRQASRAARQRLADMRAALDA